MKESSSLANKPTSFTRSNSERILKLEEDIVYLYGVLEPKRVALHYMQAIKTFDEISTESETSILRKKVLPFLEKGYSEVKQQTSFTFDVKKAASYEFDLILAQSKRSNFEAIYEIMVNLYTEIFQSDDVSIQKAALLRTFLYQYKIRLLSLDQHLSDDDISLLIHIAKRSEDELNRLVQ